MTTDERLAEIRARADEYFGVIFNRAPIPTDWPARLADSAADMSYLLAEVERLRADRDAQGRFLSTVDEFARVGAMSHDAVLEAVGVKADLDRAEATIARVRELADSWDRTRGENHRLAAGWLRNAIEGTDS